jgi:oligosaccharide repeat unit polymerase
MKFDLNNILLVIYILAWVITFAFYQRRKRHFDAGSVIIFSYLIYSISSLFLINDPFWGTEFTELHLFPFVYLFLILLLVAWPVLKFDAFKVIEIQKPTNFLFYSISILLIVSTFFCLKEALPRVMSGFLRILLDSAGGLEIYKETMDESELMNIGDGKISNLPSIIQGLLSDVGTLMFFYYLTLEKRNKFIAIGLLIACVYPILDNIAISQRGPVIDRVLTIIVTYFALKKYISRKINNLIKTIGIVLIIAISVPIVAITISRFDRPGSGGAMSSVLFYTGQENLYFNNYGLDNGGLRYADRTFPVFKRMLGFDNVPHNFYERRAKYPNLKINDEVFIGFVGDFTLDFGPYIAPLIFIFFTFFILSNTRVRKGRILFHQLILVHFVMCICIQGGMKLFSYSDLSNLRIITIFIAYWVFRIDYEQIKMRRLMNHFVTYPKVI